MLLVKGLPVRHKGLLINEVLVDHGTESFVEVLSLPLPDVDELTKPKYGIIIIDTSDIHHNKRFKNVRHGAKISTIVDISSIIGFPFTESKYYVIGNPRQTWSGEFHNVDQMLRIDAGAIDYMRTSTRLDEWLHVRPPSIKAIILTKSDTSIKDVWTIGQSHLLEDHTSLKDYIARFQIDCVMFRGGKANWQTCSPIDEHINVLSPAVMTPRYLPYPMKSAGEIPISVSRCTELNIPYLHSKFKGGSPTPFQGNDCTKMPWNVDKLLSEYLLPVSSRTNNDNCGPLEPEDIDMNDMSGESASTSLQKLEIYNAATTTIPDGPESSILRNIIPTDQAETILTLRDVGIQSQRLLTQGPSGSDPNEQTANHMRPTRFQVVKEWLKCHVPDLFDFDELENHSEWFDIVENFENPEDSYMLCGICSEHRLEFGIKDRNKLDNGVGIKFFKRKADNMREILSHSKVGGHKEMIAQVRKDLAVQRLETLQNVNEGRDGCNNRNGEAHINDVTCNHFRTTFVQGKKALSHETHPALVELQIANKVPMGDGCKSGATSARMTEVLGDMEFDDFIYIFTRSLRPWALICDGSSDAGIF